jgi:hypothetical protein
MRYKFLIFQKVATVDGVGVIHVINYATKKCEVYFKDSWGSYSFSDLIKV